MKLNVNVELDYSLSAPADILLQIEVAKLPDQHVLNDNLVLSEAGRDTRISGEDGIGERLWLHRKEGITASYTATVDIKRQALDCRELDQSPVHQLPSETVKYLMGSRYCNVSKFQSFVMSEFGDWTGGDRVMRMRDWIEERFSYTPGASNAETTAVDTFVSRQGICRDYAHVLIAFARASAIPARMASVYAVGVEPPDFHAVAEVYLGGDWQLVDPTGMAPVDGIAKIGIGRDAADISFLTCYGAATLNTQSVEVAEA